MRFLSVINEKNMSSFLSKTISFMDHKVQIRITSSYSIFGGLSLVDVYLVQTMPQLIDLAMKRTQHLALGSHQPWMKRAVESWSKLNPDVVGFYHVFRFCPGQGGKLLGKTIGKRAWESYLVWQKLVLVCSHMPPREVLTRAKKKKKILNAREEFLLYT